MGLRVEKSFCRLFPGSCGMILHIDDEAKRIEHIVGDHAHRQTMGYACIKGLVADEAHHGPARILRPLKRMPDGSYAEVPLEQALDEIASRLGEVIAQHGPDSLGGYRGTHNYLHTTANHMLSDWLK